MKGHPINYSAEELVFIKANSTLPREELFVKFQEQFSRPEATKNNLASLCKRNGWLTGRTGHYKKGNIPHPLARPKGPNKTSFKKGQSPANCKPLYSERISKDGYIEVKVPEKNPHTGAETHYRLKHRWLWESHHGPVPDGHILHFIDGNKQNCALENLEVIHRGVNAILNTRGHSSVPDELRPAVKSLAKLTHKQFLLSER